MTDRARKWSPPSIPTLGLVVLAGLGCRTPDVIAPTGDPGTFVGNPEMSARYIDNPTQQARGGRLVAPEFFLEECGADRVPLGSASFDFEGSAAREFVQIPEGSYCGAFVVVQELTIRFDDAGLKTVTADNFDIEFDLSFEANGSDSFFLVLGDEQWLAEISAEAEFGDNFVDGSNPALDEAFFGRLTDTTVVETDSPEPEPDYAGRVDIADYTESPSGTPVDASPCGPSNIFDLAVPIPPAAMASVGLDPTDAGWCESEVRIADVLDDQFLLQYDYAVGGVYEILYNGQPEECGALHCGQVFNHLGEPQSRACSVLAYCDGDGGQALVTGYDW